MNSGAVLTVGCPVKADVVVRGAGLASTPQAEERLRELMVPRALRGGQLDLTSIASLIASKSPVFT